ncbi:hypothetical protein [Nannocystis bainbridge]|uniref:Uncharacterized protein n=1 Tax=Nannocystis bainbridge TaxID=2995303 RepID=A0ABT5ECP4_9BACT|nr:hypothetical protein [Nannocystis bainbridge]MDC0722551.1 hypothetical protein [Nannocystis bainbridge]
MAVLEAESVGLRVIRELALDVFELAVEDARDEVTESEAVDRMG